MKPLVYTVQGLDKGKTTMNTADFNAMLRDVYMAGYEDGRSKSLLHEVYKAGYNDGQKQNSQSENE